MSGVDLDYLLLVVLAYLAGVVRYDVDAVLEPDDEVLSRHLLTV